MIPLRGAPKRDFPVARQGIRGAAAIEFAVVFPLFLIIFYAIVSYSFPFLLISSFQHAATEGTRAALSVDRRSVENGGGDYEQVMREMAARRAAQALTWSPDNVETRAEIEDAHVIVEVIYPDYIDQPIVPVLKLPLVGPVPRVPNDLRATATVRF